MRYASFILADEGSDMTADNLSAVIKAAGGKVEAYLFLLCIANRVLAFSLRNPESRSATLSSVPPRTISKRFPCERGPERSDGARYWPTMFAKLMEGKDMKDYIKKAGTPGSGGGGGGGARASLARMEAF